MIIDHFIYTIESRNELKNCNTFFWLSIRSRPRWECQPLRNEEDISQAQHVDTQHLAPFRVRNDVEIGCKRYTRIDVSFLFHFIDKWHHLQVIFSRFYFFCFSKSMAHIWSPHPKPSQHQRQQQSSTVADDVHQIVGHLSVRRCENFSQHDFHTNRNFCRPTFEFDRWRLRTWSAAPCNDSCRRDFWRHTKYVITREVWLFDDMKHERNNVPVRERERVRETLSTWRGIQMTLSCSFVHALTLRMYFVYRVGGGCWHVANVCRQWQRQSGFLWLHEAFSCCSLVKLDWLAHYDPSSMHITMSQTLARINWESHWCSQRRTI